MSEYEKLQTLLHQDGSGPSYRILNTERPVGIEVFIHDPNLIRDRVTFLNRPDGLLDVIDTNYGQIGKAVKAEEAVNLFRERRNGMVRWGWIRNPLPKSSRIYTNKAGDRFKIISRTGNRSGRQYAIMKRPHDVAGWQSYHRPAKWITDQAEAEAELAKEADLHGWWLV